MQPNLLAICTSPKKGHSKMPVSAGTLRVEHGLVGDAHAGNWHRQLSMVAVGDIEFMRSRGLPGLRSGSFAENFVIGDIDFRALGIGSRLRLGEAAEIPASKVVLT